MFLNRNFDSLIFCNSKEKEEKYKFYENITGTNLSSGLTHSITINKRCKLTAPCSFKP